MKPQARRVCTAAIMLALAQILWACGGGASPTSAPVSTSAPTQGATERSPTAAATESTAVGAGTATSVTGAVTAAATITVPAVSPSATAAPTAMSTAAATSAPTSTAGPTAPISTVAPTAAAIPTGMPTSGPTAEATRGAGATAPVPKGYKLYRSKTHPYTIAYPVGYAVQEGLRSGDTPFDQFVKIARPLVFVNVGVEDLPKGLSIDSETYIQAASRQLRKLGATQVRRAGETTIDGHKAYLVQSRLRVRGQPVLLTQAAFVVGDKAWILSYGTAADQHQKFMPVFRTMLRTFRLNDEARQQ